LTSKKSKWAIEQEPFELV